MDTFTQESIMIKQNKDNAEDMDYKVTTDMDYKVTTNQNLDYTSEIKQEQVDDTWREEEMQYVSIKQEVDHEHGVKQNFKLECNESNNKDCIAKCNPDN